jgi:hypothetical protein
MNLGGVFAYMAPDPDWARVERPFARWPLIPDNPTEQDIRQRLDEIIDRLSRIEAEKERPVKVTIRVICTDHPQNDVAGAD